MSQTKKLLELLQDGNWHSTPEILEKVYGNEHLGIARIGARVYDISKHGHKIESRKKDKTIWEYRLPKKDGSHGHSGTPIPAGGELFVYKQDQHGIAI